MLPSRVGLFQACRGEEVYQVARGPFGDQVGQDLAYHAAELVAVPRKPEGDYDLWMLRVQRDHEVLVRRVGVHARPRVEAATRQLRDVLRKISPEEIYLFLVNLPVDRLRGGGDAARPEEGGLHAAVVILGGEAVELVAVIRLPDEDGETIREEGLEAARRLEPVHHLPLHLERDTQIGEQLRGPGAG